MPISEERYTLWVDGKLTGLELEAFERELAAEDLTACFADREDAHKLGDFLRRYTPEAPAGNGEFFCHQVAHRIEVEGGRVTSPDAREPFRWWLPHLAWAAAFCLLLSFTIYRGTPATRIVTITAPAPGVALAKNSAPLGDQILETRSEDPAISVTPVTSEKDGLTVVWLDGLDYLPASYQLQ